ncbi:Uncharacterized protein conserved in bacteria [Serratia liquefaciens]|nr:Uncharacterized protein conserved in bacteria [Serratia liquefaciens]
MTLSQDILAELAEITPGSPLDQARAVRDAATRHAQGSYEVLFRQQTLTFLLMNASRWPRRWQNCTRRTRWRRTMPVSASPIRPPIVWSRRWPLPACSPSPPLKPLPARCTP